MTLLCRTAENLYWMGRYLERAEALTRLVREHTALVVDLPTSVPLGWGSLLAVPGAVDDFRARHGTADERNVIHYLLADRGNPGSVVTSLDQARENLRTTRATLPRLTWRILNEVVMYVHADVEAGCRRGRRNAFCERVTAGCQRLSGYLGGSMGRDWAWDFYQLGVQLERADMTSRVLDVRAAGLVDSDDETAAAIYRDSQWLSVLRSLEGLQLYRRLTGALVAGTRVVDFVIHEPRFPRSLRFGIEEMEQCLRALPSAAEPLERCEEFRTVVRRARHPDWTAEQLHHFADEVQVALINLDDAIGRAYFDATATVPAVVEQASAAADLAALGAAVPSA